VLSFALPGNTYPVTEDSTGPNTRVGFVFPSVLLQPPSFVPSLLLADLSLVLHSPPRSSWSPSIPLLPTLFLTPGRTPLVGGYNSHYVVTLACGEPPEGIVMGPDNLLWDELVIPQEYAFPSPSSTLLLVSSLLLLHTTVPFFYVLSLIHTQGPSHTRLYFTHRQNESPSTPPKIREWRPETNAAHVAEQLCWCVPRCTSACW
jgi:hypothetical protein